MAQASDYPPDLVQQAFRQARQREAVEELKFLIRTAWLALVSVPALLALILWRVW